MTKLRTGRHFTWWNFRRTFLPLNFTFSLDTFFYLCAGSSQFFLLKKQMFHHSKAEWEARRCKVRGGNPQGGCRSAHSMLLPPVNRGWIPVSSLTQKYHSHLCYTLIQTLIILELRSLLQRNLETGLSNEKNVFSLFNKYPNTLIGKVYFPCMLFTYKEWLITNFRKYRPTYFVFWEKKYLGFNAYTYIYKDRALWFGF